MNRSLELKKGDKVVIAIEPGSNVARHMNMSVSNIEKWTFNGEVISSGRKYITVEFSRSTMKFCVEDDYRNKYSCGGADYRLYQSIEEVYSKFKSEELFIKIKSKFSGYENKYSLESLEQIYEILSNEE